MVRQNDDFTPGMIFQVKTILIHWNFVPQKQFNLISNHIHFMLISVIYVLFVDMSIRYESLYRVAIILEVNIIPEN